VNDGTWTPAGTGSDGWYLGDFDGDEDTDIFRRNPGLSNAEVFLSDGSQFNYDGSWTEAGVGSDDWHIGDFNGDSQFDLFRRVVGVSGAEVFLSSGGAAGPAAALGYVQNSAVKYESRDYTQLNAYIDLERPELSIEDGERFLTPFIEMTQRGEVPTILELKEAYEALVGRKVRRVEIFRLLDRHNWEQRIGPFQIDKEEYPIHLKK
jgi:hypothetical protein